MTSKKGKSKKNESKYLNSTPIEALLQDSILDLGSIDTVEATRIFKRNWVDTIRDLRLLHRENELKTLVRIHEKLLAWLSKECDKEFADDLSPDLMMFIYKYDLDKNGIVYNIATDFGQKPWSNPGQSGKIGVHLSSMMHDSHPVYAVLGRSSVRCVSKPEKNSWLIIDFTPKLIRPTHYTIRHYSTWDTEALRCWTFEGSNDGGQSWKLLARHENDCKLNQKGVAATWNLAEYNKSGDALNQFYSHFRILQTEFNSNKHYYLACSGFEIYGAMKDMDEAKMSEHGYKSGVKGFGSGGKSKIFIPSYDFDTNGIIYWLGTDRGIRPWKNPAQRGTVRIVPSSLAKDSHPAYAAVGRETVRCVTEPKKSSWFMIDLSPIKIIPTHYSMRHYSSFDTECVRNWRFEACNNSKHGSDGQWITLLNHINDTNLNHKGATHTWQIPQNQVNQQRFSQFRLFQVGVNSNQHHYLPLSGFEIYGTVFPNDVSSSSSSSYARSGFGSQSVQKPQGRERKFIHRSDFDTNGLFYFLGCQGGNRAQYSNPADFGMVSVSSSSLMSDSQPLSALVGRLSTRCATKPQQRSWMAIHLKNVKIKLTHYTLRHYNSWDTEALRYWNLEGSNDGNSWIPIRQHMDDRALRKAGCSHTWAVDANNQYYNHFRLYMTGRNSNNHWYLACSGMELYGSAYGGIVSERAGAVLSAPAAAPIAAFNNLNMNPMQQQPFRGANAVQMMPNMMQQQQNLANNSLSFDYSRDFDGKGLVHFLGTNCSTKQWQNPSLSGAILLSSSGLMHDSAPISDIVGQKATRCVTKPLKHSWICINLQTYAIKPTHYTLRHYASWDTEALRNWRFEGSLDGERWTILREHHNDESLRFKGQSFTWMLPNISQYFSQFRVFQFDKNSNNHYYLACSGFEVYGSVIRQNPRIVWDAGKGRNKSKYLQVDLARNAVANIGSDDTWQTVKASSPLNYGLVGENEFIILVERAENTSNAWKFMVGIAPNEFSCNGSRQWLGSQKSYAYIGGTGGKCYDNPKSMSYGKKWPNKVGDIVTVKSSIKRRTIEFLLCDQSQGIAFENFAPANSRNMFAAVSITATGSRLRLMERVTPQTKPVGLLQSQHAHAHAPSSPRSMMANALHNNNNMRAIPNIGAAAIGNDYGWDPINKSPHLAIFPDGVTVTNKGSNDTWQGIVSRKEFSSGRHSFEIHIINDIKTSNQWKYIFGVAPASFDPKRTAWLGSQNSWGYIGGTGGKCHSVGKSVAYGKRFGGSDRIRVQIDFGKRSIEFFRNEKSQGIAFTNLSGSIRPAVSLTGKGAAVRICNCH